MCLFAEIVSSFGTNLLFGVQTAEKMRIDSNGQLLVGTTQSSAYGNRQMAVGDVSNSSSFLEIRSSGSGTGHLLFSQTAGANSGNYQGYIAYHQPTNHFSFHTGGGNQRARIDSDGLKFNADTAAANALDDYEEGSWTPTARNHGSFTNSTGRYVKIGQQVTVWFNADGGTSPRSGGTSSSLIMTGLPFSQVMFGNPILGIIGVNKSSGTGLYSTIGAILNAFGQGGTQVRFGVGGQPINFGIDYVAGCFTYTAAS